MGSPGDGLVGPPICDRAPTSVLNWRVSSCKLPLVLGFTAAHRVNFRFAQAIGTRCHDAFLPHFFLHPHRADLTMTMRLPTDPSRRGALRRAKELCSRVAEPAYIPKHLPLYITRLVKRQTIPDWLRSLTGL